MIEHFYELQYIANERFDFEKKEKKLFNKLIQVFS